MLFEDVDHCAIVDLQNAFLGKSFSDLPGTEVGMLELVLYHFVLIFWCEPFGMQLVSMRFVCQAFNVSAPLPKSFEVTIYSAE